jgi:hypothetical protein
MVTQDNLHAVLSMLTPFIIQRLMEERNLEEKDAADLLYESMLYEALETEVTKLWHLSPLLLYDLLEEELSTGKITWPEEQ